MDRIRRIEFDTTDEQVKVVNQIIDNLNQIEGKLLQLIDSMPKKKKRKEANNV